MRVAVSCLKGGDRERGCDDGLDHKMELAVGRKAADEVPAYMLLAPLLHPTIGF